MSVRIQKLLSHLGFASRRTIEQWIEEGRISVNGKCAKLGDGVNESDHLKLDGKLIDLKPFFQPASQKIEVLLYHKPVGEVCTRIDPQDRPTVFERLPSLKIGQWIMIGRLDINTSGLLLFTNQGDFAHQMMHPSSEIMREYLVRTFGEITPEIQARLMHGVKIDGEWLKVEAIEPLKRKSQRLKANHWYQVSLKEGKNREIRKLWESQGISVSRLSRIRYGDFLLPKDLKPGEMQRIHL